MLPGIGIPELIILLVIGLFACGLPLAVIVVVMLMVRSQSTGRMAELQEENQQLRRQLDERDEASGDK